MESHLKGHIILRELKRITRADYYPHHHLQYAEMKPLYPLEDKPRTDQRDGTFIPNFLP